MWSWPPDAEIKNDWRSTSCPYSVTQQDDYKNTKYIIAIKFYLHIGFLGLDFKHYIFSLWMQFLHCLFHVTGLFKAVWKLAIINCNPANKNKISYLPTTGKNKLQGENAYLICHSGHMRAGTLIVATIYLQLIQNRYVFQSFTVLQCSHQHCVQPIASDGEVVGYL